MNISRRGRHAMMAMVELARAPERRPIALVSLAARHGVSVSYLEQIFACLRRAGLVLSARGPGGGYLLARPGRAIRLADVIVAVDGCKAYRPEVGAADAPRAGDLAHCLTEELWRELANHMHKFLHAHSLDDLCQRRVPVAGFGPEWRIAPSAAE